MKNIKVNSIFENGYKTIQVLVKKSEKERKKMLTMKKINRFQIQKCAELYNKIINSKYPADREMQYYFKENHSLGKNDRKFIAETIYDLLRNRLKMEYLANYSNNKFSTETFLLFFLINIKKFEKDFFSIDGREYERLKKIYEDSVSQIPHDESSTSLSILFSIPEWLVSDLKKIFLDSELKDLLKSLNKEAPLTIRTNTLKISRDELKQKLEDENIYAVKTKSSTDGLIITERCNLFKTNLFSAGYFELQDEGSQLITILADCKSGEMVFDCCAGGGGKTLHLSAAMKNKGTVYAYDINARRLENLKPRIKRAGSDNIRIIYPDTSAEKKIKRLFSKFDCVLIDAPCSGMGTLRRNPDSAWKIEKKNIAEFAEKQSEILKYYSRLVKNGGRLLYSTCSILEMENENVIFNFLSENKDFQVINACDIFSKLNISLNFKSSFMKLYPHTHNTDGFFAAVLERVN